MKNMLVVLLYAVIVIACKKDTDLPNYTNLGSIDATSNGVVWPANNAETDTRVYGQRTSDYCNKNTATSGIMGLSITTRNVNPGVYSEGIGFSIDVNTITLLKPLLLESEDLKDNSPLAICKLFKRESAQASFAYMYADGADIQATTTYAINPNRVNILTITRYDTTAKIVEGQFEANFVKNAQYAGNKRPDTLQIRCARFVAAIIR